MMAVCVVLLTMNVDLVDWQYFLNNFSTTYKYEAVGVLLSLGFCILVTAFLFLCWWSFLPDKRPTCLHKFLNIVVVIGGFTGGKPQRRSRVVFILSFLFENCQHYYPLQWLLIIVTQVFLFTGLLVLAGVVLWRITVEVYLVPVHEISRKIKPTELQLMYSFPPTSLMISVILALSSVVMCLVHTCTRKKHTRKKHTGTRKND